MDYGFDYRESEQRNYNKPPRKKGPNGLFITNIILFSIAIVLIVSCIFMLSYSGTKNYIDSIKAQSTVQLNVSARHVNADNESMTVANTVAAVENSVVAIGYTQDCGNGSGVIISEDGFIVTNNHVVSDYETIYVSLTDGTVYEAHLWATDEQSDLAVIKITTDKELTVAAFGDSSKALKGEEVIVIGNPTGDLKGSISSGIISHNDRTLSIEGYIMDLIQTDASVNPGNSGGGLFNTYGELIGIVNAKIVATNVEAIGFAIPSNTVYEIVEDLIENKYVSGRPYLGLIMKVISKATFGGYTRQYIVTESKYCEEIKAGDQILSVGGKNMGEYTSQQLLYGYSIGDEIEVVLVRDSKTVVVTVVLQEYTPD